jgi:hypothetical protein
MLVAPVRLAVSDVLKVYPHWFGDGRCVFDLAQMRQLRWGRDIVAVVPRLEV